MRRAVGNAHGYDSLEGFSISWNMVVACITVGTARALASAAQDVLVPHMLALLRAVGPAVCCSPHTMIGAISLSI